jgi:hypothetical protein
MVLESSSLGYVMRHATALLLLLAMPAVAQADYHHSGKLPDGTYGCSIYSGGMFIGMGDIEITGNTYRGPAYDGKYEGSYDYEIGDKGVIFWRGPLGGFTADGHTVVSTVLTSDKIAKASFDVTVETPRETFHTINCSLQSK